MPAFARPVLVDADGDGDLDAFVLCAGCINFANVNDTNSTAPRGAALVYLRNEGSAREPVLRVARANPLADAFLHLGLPNATNVSLAFGHIDADEHVDALLSGVVLFGDGSGGFGRPTRPGEHVRAEPLRRDERPVGAPPALLDVDGDGDVDLLWAEQGGELRAARSEAARLRRRHFKCKFGPPFDARDCWSCADGAEHGAAPPHQVTDPLGHPMHPLPPSVAAACLLSRRAHKTHRCKCSAACPRSLAGGGCMGTGRAAARALRPAGA